MEEAEALPSRSIDDAPGVLRRGSAGTKLFRCQAGHGPAIGRFTSLIAYLRDIFCRCSSSLTPRRRPLLFCREPISRSCLRRGRFLQVGKPSVGERGWQYVLSAVVELFFK